MGAIPVRQLHLVFHHSPLYVLLFPEPDMSRALHFSKIDIMKFLYYFQQLEKKHNMNENDLIKMLSNYYKREKKSQMRAQKKFTKKS